MTLRHACTRLLLAAVAASLAAVTLSAQEAGRAGRGSIEDRFRQLDRNGDGKLTAEEANNPDLFKRLDRNGDGVVTLEEAREALKNRRAAAPTPPGEPPPAPATTKPPDAAAPPASAPNPPLPAPPVSGGTKPNILVILSDDHGYAEMGCQGCKDIPTPHLDSIARNGIRFTNGYVTCPICAPTRAGLLTGRYQQRFGFETNPGPETTASDRFGIDSKESTIADRLKALGYATGMFGKWHVGYKPELQPIRRGFDEFFGFLSGAHNYLAGGRERHSILRGAEPVEEKDYLTDAFGREAVAFVERHCDRPFFVYLPFNAVHAPLQAVEKYLKRFESISNPDRRTFAAMLSAMDDNVGRVLDKLREHGIEERTLVFFLADNGGPTAQTTSSNVPLRGGKGQVYEGGIRIPFLMQWKGRLPAGRVEDRPVVSLDILPTAVAAAGGTIDPAWGLDGVNLLPYLTGANAGRPHEALYWRMGPKHAIRLGDWKLVEERNSARPELYNLAEDIGEKVDLAGRMPEKVKELEAAWKAWDAQMEKPRWAWGEKGGGRPARRRER
jgi:arylsulfatase A-like enzyme